LADELIQKEALDLKEIVKIIGERPYPLPLSVAEYLNQTLSEPQ
jgi:hypothetical protein